MRYRYFAVRALDPESRAEALNRCLATEPVLSVEQAFVADGQNSFWSVRVCLSDEQASAPDKRRRGSGVDYRELLSPEHFAVYARLRSLRNRLAEEQGAPRYAIFTNEQLAAMAQLPEPSKAAIGAIEGIGEKRLASYADAFLALLLEPRDG